MILVWVFLVLFVMLATIFIWEMVIPLTFRLKIIPYLEAIRNFLTFKKKKR